METPSLTKRPSSPCQNKCPFGFIGSYSSKSPKNCVQGIVDKDETKKRLIDTSCQNVITGKDQALWSATFKLKVIYGDCVRYEKELRILNLGMPHGSWTCRSKEKKSKV